MEVVDTWTPKTLVGIMPMDGRSVEVDATTLVLMDTLESIALLGTTCIHRNSAITGWFSRDILHERGARFEPHQNLNASS